MNIRDMTYRAPKRCEDVEIIMQQVQSCPWNPFKLNEIVTLEKCLREAQNEDPRLGILFKKLAESSVFVEPTRKKQYLLRNEKKKRADSDLMKQVQLKRAEINRLNSEIEMYTSKIEDLDRQGQDTVAQISRLKKSILVVEKTYEINQKEFETLFERVLCSFERSLIGIRHEIPEFILFLTDCNLVKQVTELPKFHRKLLLRLIKKHDYYQQQHAASLSFCIKKNMVEQLSNHLKAIECLHSDLVQIEGLYSNEIPSEFEVLKELDTHIEFLEKPLREPPKKVEIVHHDLNPLAFSNYENLKAQPESIEEDPEVDKLIAKVSEEARSLFVGSGGHV